ncbi:MULTISPECIES: aminotransferase class I/II-fold pyridoxal phosphate-dependent enzyme [unclassified Paracoccus (in: a-proteobacteria)]|uniref:aminotransferase class I/II-fold pyridoxal phosphate-dependent enzyme n=1 Tax=unclassified Paracoccus (in: a-proteobacteria) TaxID=2688777 RepID=UPI0012B280A2|nr:MULTISPECIES: aminotransferase class I/II-fold pyridoxal phosphate-dependent enzyme [unclassified Paracoccus (in: a-proteobacteria)]UXU74421.1 aminotransferase class I/II-fold pyridoxal phosphate-dependent enzyme [Paracoccus sp. SMMA_5]UXU80311.1 aminotransferase class I/II-fold pyridoxal phosphate-dependent enzyme [Paracoccus sp. SMMA_5_TC]
MIPLATPNLQGREAELLAECISSTFVSSVGPFVDAFESRIAAFSGSERAAVLCSGTVALQMALQGLGIGAGDLVIVPSLTFIATPNAVSHSGARPWLVDVAADSWMLDLDLCRHAIATQTRPDADGLRRHIATGQVLRAIMPVMVMGAVADLDGVVALAREFGLKVVVDAAAAIGTEMADGRPLAATGVDAVCYSFNGNKTVTTGGGGAVASTDAGLIQRIKHLSSTGRVGANYDHDVIAYNFRMTNVQAALGVAQLERLDQFLARKRQIRDRYAAFAEARPALLAPFPETGFGRNGHWFSGFWYRGDDLTRCDGFRAHMRESGVDLRPFWKPIHLQQPYRDALATPMPVCDGLWQRIFPLPCSTHLDDAELEHVLTAAARFWGPGNA